MHVAFRPNNTIDPAAWEAGGGVIARNIQELIMCFHRYIGDKQYLHGGAVVLTSSSGSTVIATLGIHHMGIG